MLKVQTTTSEQTAAEHIPGPWFCNQESIDPEWYIVTLKGGLIVANVNAHHRQVANARLIAAAPDMLAALEFITAPQPYSATQEWRDNVKKGRELALAAIAKAKGLAR